MVFHEQRISVVTNTLEQNSSWIYLVDWILALILGIAFVFYFNRLVGLILSQLFNLLLQKKYGVKIHMQAFKVSPLGGRIVAKNLTVMTKDYTVSVVKLNLTWRYWLFKLTRTSAYFVDRDDPDGIEMDRKNKTLPFNFLLSLDGLEIFYYNRTFAYDNIIDALKQQDQDRSSDEWTSKESTQGSSLRYRNTNKSVSSSENDNSFRHKEESKQHKQATPPLFLSVLPMKIRIKKGAIVMGNASTPSILVASFKSANGAIDLTKSPSALDNYRFWHDINFDTFQVWMKPNIAYDKARYANSDDQEGGTNLNTLSHMKKYSQWYKFKRSLTKLQRLFHKAQIRRKQSSNLNLDLSEESWKGLRRYVGNQDDINLSSMISSDEQYAKYTLILDSVVTRIVYYYDDPGHVLSNLPQNPPPEHGVEIELSMATIYYGPWTDKQRVPLQSVFFPSLARDSKPKPLPHTPGALREYAGFKITTIVKDEVIFRVPTREKSKDKEILKMKNQHQQQQTSSQQPLNKVSRPFGWLELKLNQGTTFSFFTSYVADKENGWDNQMNVLLIEPEIRTSVNHDILFIADSHEINAKVGYPLEWNGKCEWQFDFISDNARIFFLREHTLLFSDIFGDFASGAPTPYEEFRPFIYNISWEFQNYKLYLNVNDANIINNPLDFNVNKYLSFQGESLTCDLSIPLYGEFAKSSTVDYSIKTSFFNLVLDTPPWHTAKTFMTESNVVGRANNFTIDGCYTFFSSIEVNTSDYIEIRMIGDYVTLKFYGYLIKYLFIIRENYFGDHIHFRTFEEFSNTTEADAMDSADSVSKDSSISSESSEIDFWKIIKTDNDVDILFTFQVRHGLIVLPLNQYDCKSHIGLSFDSLDVDIRFTNYYMDLQGDLSPISASYVNGATIVDIGDMNDIVFDIPYYKSSHLKGTPELTIDGLTIHAHRMFGLPPDEITYYCKWDFEAGDIAIDSDMSFIGSLGTGIENFAYGYKDIENSMMISEPVVFDALNLSFRCDDLKIKLSVGGPDSNVFFSIHLWPIIFAYNDMANKRYSTRASASIPQISIEIIEQSSDSKKVLGAIETSLVLNNFCQKKNMLEHRKNQQEHIKHNDAPFHRSPFLLFEEFRDTHYHGGYGCFLSNLALPDVNHPLNSFSTSGTSRSADVFDSSLSSDSLNNWDDSSVRRNPLDPFNTDTSAEDSQDEFHPTQRYHASDYIPAYEPDPLFEYDNIILELGEIKSFLSPCGLFPIAKLIQEKNEFSLERLMDKLEIEVVTGLNSYFTASYSIANFRLITQEVSLKFGAFDVKRGSDVFEKTQKVPYTNILVMEPSLALSFKKEKPEKMKRIQVDTDVTMALHIKEFFVSTYNPSTFKPPMSLTVKDVESWAHVPIDCDIVSSSNIQEIDLDVQADQIGWLLDYSFDLYSSLKPAIEEFSHHSISEDQAVAELVYKLTLASVEFSIDNDSDVLTKPANILRSSDEHVRFFDSWKIVSRLRHILSNLPREWRERQNKLFKTTDWQVPDTAVEEISNIFSRWRSWEANHAQRAFFFNYILSKKNQKVGKQNNTNAQFNLPEILVNISGPSDSFDFINIRNSSLVARILNEFRETNQNGVGFSGEVSVFDIVLNLVSYKGHLSTISINMFKKINDFVNTKKVQALKKSPSDQGVVLERTEASMNLKSAESKHFSLLFNLEKFQQAVKLPTLGFELNSDSICWSSEIATYEDIIDVQLFSSVSKMSSFELIVKSNDLQLASLAIFGLDTFFSNVGELSNGAKIADLSVEKISFKLFDKKQNLLKSIQEILENDVPYLKSLIPKESISTPVTSTKEVRNPARPSLELRHSSKISAHSSYILRQIGDFAFKVSIRNFSWLIDIMSPMSISGSINDNKLSVENLDGVLLIDSFIQKIDLEVRIFRDTILELSNYQTVTSLKYDRHEDLNMISLSSTVGYTKLFVPSIVGSIKVFLKSLPHLKEKANSLKNLFETDKPKNSGSKEPTNMIEMLNSFAFKVKLSNDYIGVSTLERKTKYSLEIEGASIGIYNFSNSQDKNFKYVAPYGNFEIPTARLNVIDRSIPIGFSNFLDFNIEVRVLNCQDHLTDLQSLQIESQYCRVCLSSPALIKIVSLADSVMKVLDSEVNMSSSKVDSIIGKENLTQPKASPDSTFSFLDKFASVHLLAYNFCFGWLFEDSPKDYPGVILGAERFFAIMEEKVGKLTLMEAYLSVANGTRSSNYFSTSSEKNNLNRAFLPTMQLVYNIEKDEDKNNMRINIHGDELDVKFLSNSVVIVGYAVNSVSRMQKFFATRVKQDSPVVKQTPKDMESPTEYMSSIKSVFDSIELVATYEGSNVLFYRLSDSTTESAPSLYLHSPAVKIAAMYKHTKQAERKHIIKGEVLTSSSENVLYPSCIPVIFDIAEGVKDMMRKIDKQPPVSPTKATENSQPSKGFDFANVFNDIDIHFGMRIDKQALTLSCAPTAKVAAIVGLEGIYMQLNSEFAEAPSLVLGVLFDSVSASLQHVYSREISGTVGFKNAMLTSSMKFGDVASILSSASLVDVDGYVNVKQFQDVELFKDIWFPKEYYHGEIYRAPDLESNYTFQAKSELASNKNISSRFKEVSTSYAIPWVLTFIVSNINLRVDFGQALGDFKLKLGKVWAVSKKSTDWAQDLKIGVDLISLKSEGRLGGSFDVTNVNIHTAISWKLENGSTLDVPLILLSGGIDQLALKMSFDYHVFAIANIQKISIDVFNQKNEISISKDHLFVCTKLDSAELFITSLTASNCLDIYHTISRMMQENKRSYKETLRESSRGKSISKKPQDSAVSGADILETVKKLETRIQVIAGRILVHVYPSSFDDSKVLVIHLDESKANFQQNEFKDGISNDLEIQFNDLNVSLSMTSTVSEDFIAQCEVEEFVEYAHKARGGTIFVFPSFKISMRTYQKYDNNVIEYLYQSSFGGTVDVRWNLGSVNFIREMYSIHSKALKSRIEYRKNTFDATKFNEDIFNTQGSKSSAIMKQHLDEEDPTEEIDHAINETLNKVSDDSKYVYTPLAPAIIEAPQLKELGNATPPLEWFGLHRDKFPNVTHQVGIVSLQKLMHEVESQYSKILGKA